MDSDSELSLSRTSARLDGGLEESLSTQQHHQHQQRVGRNAAARPRVLQLEAGGEDDATGGPFGGDFDGSGAPPQQQQGRRGLHVHTLSAASLSGSSSFPNGSALHSSGGVGSATSAASAASSLTAPSSSSGTEVEPAGRSGWLYKRGNLNSSWKKRWFVLRYQTLKYYKKPSDTKAKGFISLSAALLTPGSTDKMRRLFGFEISSLKYTRVFVIHAETEREMHEWMNCLQENMNYVRQVIEREKKQNASSSSGAGGQQAGASGSAADPYSDTHAALLAARKLPPEQTLDLEVSEEYLKHIGVPARLSSWRRPIARQAFESRSADLVRTSALKKGERMSDACCFTTHNSLNMMAAGLGSNASVELEKGAIQLISIETRESVSNLKQIARFGDLEAAADEIENEEEEEESEDQGSELDDDEGGSSVGRGRGVTSSSSAAGAASASVIPMPCVGDVCALSWVNDLLFAGSSGGLVALYKLPADLALGSLSKLTPTVMLSHPKVASVPLAAPGKWSLTSRIGHVSLNAVDRRSLLTLANHHFFVWDMEVALATVAPGRPSHQLSEIGSSQPLFAAAWNAHSSHEFMFGGEEGALRMLDTRVLMSGGGGGGSNAAAGVGSSCVSWISKHAHNDVIRDIAWSPLVPHWVASAGDDGLIKVWDLRFGSEPVRVLNGHTASVASIAWSKSHCEMLSSAGVDKTLRVWNLRVAPHYALYTHAASLDDFSAPVIHTAWSPVHPFQVLGASAAGEAVTVHVGDHELMDVFVNHRALTNSTAAAAAPATAAVAASPPAEKAAGAKGSKQQQQQLQESKEKTDADDDVKLDTIDLPLAAGSGSPALVRSSSDELHERQIETLLFHRDFDRAFRAVAALANKYWANGQHSFAEGLLKLTSASLFSAAAQEPSKVAAAASERGLANPNNLKSFNQLMNDLSRFIPSMTLRLSNVEPATHTRIQFLKTRIAVLQLIKARRWKDILALSGEICSHLERGGGVAGGPGSTGAGSPTSGSGVASTGASASSSGSDGLTSLDQFDASLLEKMAQAVLPFDHLRALEFCLRIGKTLQAAGNFALFLGVARAVFLPTIYERMDAESNAAAQCSWIKVLAPLAHTSIGSAGGAAAAAASAAAAAQAREESRGSESESDNESSSNSRSNSSQPSRKPSDVGLAAPARVLRPSISGAPPVLGGASGPSSPLGSSLALSNARASVVGGGGGDAHSAQITLDRDLRNPKIVLAQLSLLLNMLTLVANDEDGGSEVSALGSPSSGGSSSSAAAKRKGSERGGPSAGSSDDVPTRFNPFVAVQHASTGSSISLDTLGFPVLSALAAKDLARLLDDQKEPLKLLPSLLHFLYMHALVSSKKYDLLFVSATKINSSPLVRHTQFAAVLEGVMNEVTTPRFVKFLERLLNREPSAASAPAGAAAATASAAQSKGPVGSNLLKLQAAALTLTNMCFNMDYVPLGLGSILPRYLREFTEELRKALSDMRSNPDYIPSTSYTTARADVKSKAEFIVNQIARIKSHSKSMAMQAQGGEPHCAAQIAELNSMLRKFLE